MGRRIAALVCSLSIVNGSVCWAQVRDGAGSSAPVASTVDKHDGPLRRATVTWARSVTTGARRSVGQQPDDRSSRPWIERHPVILPFMESKGRAMVEGMPAPQQASMFGYLKKFAGTFTEVTVTKETVTGDTALLELSGKDPKGQAATGTVPVTKEATGWKVGAEKWSSKPRMPLS